MSRARALVAACSLLGLVHAGELDLLAALALGNGSRAGVAADAAPGPLPHRNVYALQGDNRSLQVADGAFARAVELLRRSPEFTLLAAVRQQRSNTGTIVSFSHGYNRYLELQSSGRRDEIRLHYVSAGSATARVETFPFRLADGVWHKLALSVSGAQAQLLVDCHPLYRRLIQPPDRNFSQPQLSLWVGQRNSKHSLFKGLIQDVRLISGPHGYLTQCPNLDSECPTCGQFSLLQATVQELTAHIHDLSLKLLATEERINRLEECDCQKSCYSNDTMHPDGASWQKDCNKCSCVHGEITCRPVECERADCKNPIIHPGECCPTCLKQCLLKGTLYEHGDRYAPKECAECVCHDGNMNCKRVDPETACPALPCDLDQQFSVAGECCKFCPGVDYCSMGHSCDENATCMNLNTKYTCKCNMGFQGDGLTCEDVDECLSAGGHYGHHCHANTKCMNVVGSYICQCNPGYARADKFNCVEIDECTIGSHSCSEHARCENTAGSYKCHCLTGYTGNGYECKPICEGGCLNGGQCASPNQCECKPGFTGKYCETDVDECSSGSQLCPPSSDCVNMPGWYYCNCKPGYRSHLAPDPQMSAVCTDIDECAEGLHTCHSTAECRNIEGSYQCSCAHPDCKLSCMQNGNEYSEGSKWVEAGGCRGCTCTQGVLSCAPAPCICARDFNNTATGVVETGSAPIACCPQCEAQYDCRHQELHHVLFRSGQRWIYQCQTCECLLGEVDCWDLDCPGSVADCCGRPEDFAACGHNSSTHSHCQVAYCATLVSNIACCVHRSVPRSVAAALLAWAWWGAGGGWPAPHRKHRGCRPPRSPREPHLSALPI